VLSFPTDGASSELSPYSE